MNIYVCLITKSNYLFFQKSKIKYTSLLNWYSEFQVKNMITIRNIFDNLFIIFLFCSVMWYFVCCRKLGLDLVPRQGAHMVDPDTMSVVELYHVVIRTKQNLNNNWLSQKIRDLALIILSQYDRLTASRKKREKIVDESRWRGAWYVGKEKKVEGSWVPVLLCCTYIARVHWNSSWSADHFKYSARIEMKPASGYIQCTRYWYEI